MDARSQETSAPAPNVKQITIVVGTPPGSPASRYAQLVSRHMGRHMVGRPAIVVQHMPGAGGMTAANTAYLTLPRDGSTLVSTNSAIMLEPILGGKGAQFDPRKFSWIGATHAEPMTCVTWHTSAVRTLEEARGRPAIIGSYGADGPSAVFARAANNVAGTRFSLITGYAGGTDAILAMERGEVDGFCAMGWHDLSLRHPEWLQQRKVNILFQMGLEKEAALPEVPLLLDHVHTAADRKALELLVMPLEIGRPLYAPPDVPPAQVELLRSTLAAALRDPQLRAEAEKTGLPIRHLSGERVHALIEQLYAAPEHVVARARSMQK